MLKIYKYLSVLPLILTSSNEEDVYMKGNNVITTERINENVTANTLSTGNYQMDADGIGGGSVVQPGPGVAAPNICIINGFAIRDNYSPVGYSYVEENSDWWNSEIKIHFNSCDVARYFYGADTSQYNTQSLIDYYNGNRDHSDWLGGVLGDLTGVISEAVFTATTGSPAGGDFNDIVSFGSSKLISSLISKMDEFNDGGANTLLKYMFSDEGSVKADEVIEKSGNIFNESMYFRVTDSRMIFDANATGPFIND